MISEAALLKYRIIDGILLNGKEDALEKVFYEEVRIATY